MAKKPILCLDFDGVIHSYDSGWQGEDKVVDLPVPGAFDFIDRASRYFEVHIYSSRSKHRAGIDAMLAWFEKHSAVDGTLPDWYEMLVFSSEKPPAFLTIDDRAIQFTGVWPSIADLIEFKPWNKR